MLTAHKIANLYLSPFYLRNQLQYRHQNRGVDNRPSSMNIGIRHHIRFVLFIAASLKANKFCYLESRLFLANPNCSLQTKLGQHLEFLLSHSSSISLCPSQTLRISYYLREHRVLDGFFSSFSDSRHSPYLLVPTICALHRHGLPKWNKVHDF